MNATLSVKSTGAPNSAILSCSMSSRSDSIKCSVKTSATFAEIKAGLTVVRYNPIYEGEYEVTPAPWQLSLETKDKAMAEDIVINPIPYYETSNEYGYTVYIGGEY